jgi:RecB family exonuclease
MCDEHALRNKYKCQYCFVKENVKLDCISSTMFESYLKCGWSFKHEFILNTIPQEQRQNKYSITGSLLHDLFDKYSYKRPLLDVKEDALNECAKLYDKLDKSYFDSDEDFTEFKHNGMMTLDNFIEFEKDREVPMLTEQQHFFNVDGIDIPIRATFDRINGNKDNPAKWVVEDYKTGKVYSSHQLHNNMQLPIYALAIKTIYGALPKRLKLIFPKHLDRLKNVQTREFNLVNDDVYVCDVWRGGIYTFSVSDKLKQMQEIYSKIRDGIFPFNTKNSKFCTDFCSLGKNNLCNGINTQWKSIKEGTQWKNS